MQLSHEQLLQAYRTMRTIRAFEERIHLENTTGDIPGFVHLYAGEEAIAAGVCSNLNEQDYIASTHRGHGHCIAKGCDVVGMMKEIYGRAGGLCGGKGGSMHIADLEKGMLGANAIVGGAPPLAMGAALSAKTLANGRVAVAFAGDGASNQGTVFEAINMAVVLSLPVLFVFENNGYGEGTGHDYAVGSKDIAGRCAGFGLPTESVDGTDFFSVQEASRAAVERARNGEGPSALECKAKRFFGHFEGDPQLYRSQEEIKTVREQQDCLIHFRDRTCAGGLLKSDELDGIDREVAELIDGAVTAARAAAFPDPSEVLTDVYKTYL